FGNSVALSAAGNTALVGAFLDDVGVNSDQGAAYVFVRSGSIWTQQVLLTASDGAEEDFFGNSVALSGDGDTALVGASGDDVGTNSDQGAAYVFVRSDSSWTQQTLLTANDGAASDRFGSLVALSNDGMVTLVGTTGDDVGANTNQGSAYIIALP
ncbi:MAG: hypothetical protein H7Y11_13120, partial [Armatimonadetes bacterium]|nr:hypothetical protein [Anaerolineae bacterium]